MATVLGRIGRMILRNDSAQDVAGVLIEPHELRIELELDALLHEERNSYDDDVAFPEYGDEAIARALCRIWARRYRQDHATATA
jgi:hypothetical protein